MVTIIHIKEYIENNSVDFYGVYCINEDKDILYLFKKEQQAKDALYELTDLSEYLISLHEDNLSMENYETTLKSILTNRIKSLSVHKFNVPPEDNTTISAFTTSGKRMVTIINSVPVDLTN